MMLAEGNKNFCLDPNFWISQWEQVEKLARTGLNKEFVKAQRWDKLSKDFSQRWKVSGEDPIRDEMISLLKGKNIVREGMKILDLGCGTGRFAIPFAQAGAWVTAVDVSEGMLRYLKEETPAEVASRITPVQLDWYKADLDQLGFRSAFDLSFAHMNPAISGPEAFLKFLSTSRQWCALAIWTGKRRQNTMEAVWRHLSGKDLDQNAGDITLPFNLLYGLGYRPFVEFQDYRYENMIDPETEADQLFDLFHEHVEHLEGNEEEIRQRILSFLQGMARQVQRGQGEQGGQDCRKWQVCQGSREGQGDRENQQDKRVGENQGSKAGQEGQGKQQGQDCQQGARSATRDQVCQQGQDCQQGQVGKGGQGHGHGYQEDRQGMIKKILTGCVARMVWKVDRSDAESTANP
jgi:SAM-dependent methyltransferase